MSSASKGRYQSRLFNFFHKQSRRFGERFGHSLRKLQVATSWYAEALSKTVYLLLQKAANSAGIQLPGTVGEPKLYLQPSEEPSSDAATIRVLENVETRYIPSSTNQSTTANYKITASGSSSQQIQGVASQLSSQNLVLVTSENEILDILTPSQQQALENQIISEIAHYWRLWRLSQENQETKLPSTTNNFLKRFTNSNANPNKALPTVDASCDRKYLQINPATVASLDTVIANLETTANRSLSRAQIIVRQRGGELIKVVKTRLDIFLYGNKQVTISKQDIVADENLETHPSKIQALIWAAFNYFYSKPEDKKIDQAPPTRYISSTKPLPQLQSEKSQDNWLSNADLFGNGFPQLNPRNRTSNKLEASKQQLNPSTNIKNSSEKLFGRFQMPNWRTLRLKEKAGLVQPQKGILNEQDASITSQNAQKIAINSTSELQSRSKREIAANQTNESTEIEAKPEWIETKAEIVGYQKHPLEQVLTWIDNTMLKIEEAIAKFAKALQQLWRK
ncbi:hypothetical protein [Calothrix sp. CCY 0018]|uniref:hypothetical protein n=1 Tax=Calothrix sp. CCY 0018 TaxID=3103864 RepID=UPI0039C629D3